MLSAAASITRAAMLNVAEHSGAARARIDWRVEPAQLVVCVVDDGTGFDPQRAACGGLGAMRRRAKKLGGSFKIDSDGRLGGADPARLPLRVDHACRPTSRRAPGMSALGDRELTSCGWSPSATATARSQPELFLSPHTVKFHIANIFEKLGADTRRGGRGRIRGGPQPGAEPAAA